MIKIIELENKNIWEEFVLGFKGNSSFFQSWNWGEVQKRLGNKVMRVGVYKNNSLQGVCLLVEVDAKRGHFLHLRHGPLLNNFKTDLESFIQFIKQRAISMHCNFIRMSALLEDTEKNRRMLSRLTFRNAPIHNMDAENAWVLDLDKGEEDLLKEMRKTTRYLIRRSQSIPLVVRQTNDPKDFKLFMKLYTETSKRHNFVPHRGIQEEFEVFSKDDQSSLFVAEYKRKIIAGALIIYYGNQAVYHHGSSSDAFRDIPGAYLIQWNSILEAKRRGKTVYNFWGVVPENKKNHPWRGLTLFKTGFGGRKVNFIHAQDLPFSIGYWKTFCIEYATKVMKGY